MGTTALATAPAVALLWAPRLLGIAISMFLALFSLDAFGGAATLGEAIPDFIVHLIPAALVLAVMALSWNREWIGAVTLAGLAVAYAMAARAHPSWIAAVSGPLLVAAALYGWNWRRRKAVGSRSS